MTVRPDTLERASMKQRSQARAELALRIAAAEDAQARIEQLRKVDAWALVADASNARESAAAALRSAEAADAEAATDALIERRPAPDNNAAAARSALETAEERLAAARRAQAAVAAEIEELGRSAPLRSSRLDDAAAVVVKVEASDALAVLVAELDAMAEAWLDKSLALRALIKAHGVAPTDGHVLTKAGRTARRLEIPPTYWGLDSADRPTLAAWERALAALKSDADAVLPNAEKATR